MMKIVLQESELPVSGTSPPLNRLHHCARGRRWWVPNRGNDWCFTR